MRLGTGMNANLYYCGKEALPGSDGQCGPNSGPQCTSCRTFQQQSGRTALYLSAHMGHLEVVKHLVEQGANVDAKTLVS